MNERGFALIAALWVIAVLSGVVGAGVASARVGQLAAQNRIVMTRGRWAAEACLAIAEARSVAGRLPDSATIDLGRTTRCRWQVTDPAARLNVTTATENQLALLFRAVGLAPDSAVHLARAISVVASGGTFWDINSIVTLPGFHPRVLQYLTADGVGQVNLAVAPAPVLSALPGLNGEAVQVLLTDRRYGPTITSLNELNDALSPVARAVLEKERRELTRYATFSSSQLVIYAEGWVEAFGEYPRTTIDLLAVPLQDRLAVVRRRMT